MIQETIVTTLSTQAQPHLAPMGIQHLGDALLMMPFKPSRTLENILATGVAVVNYSDDVRVFAGALTGHHDWPLVPTQTIECRRLSQALSHLELALERTEEHELRPKLFFRITHQEIHAPFQGFNRAQFSVIEASILVSRLHMLDRNKIIRELRYLAEGFHKTKGPKEEEAWAWLMARVTETLGARWEETST
jgi:hypothetical protein